MKKIVILTTLIMTPCLTLAATAPSNFKELVFRFIEVINKIIPVVVALALLFFFWGIAMFIFHADNEEKKKESRNIMIWGIIALFAMVAIWGIIKMLLLTFGFSTILP
jgi:hypothetical protein